MSQPNDPCGLIPSPQVVRARLARNLREARLLRSLLRLARHAAVEQERLPDQPDRVEKTNPNQP